MAIKRYEDCDEVEKRRHWKIEMIFVPFHGTYKEAGRWETRDEVIDREDDARHASCSENSALMEYCY